VRTFLFLGDRPMIRTQSVVAALDMLRRGVRRGSDLVTPLRRGDVV